MGPEGSKVLEGEQPVSASEADVVGLLEAVVQVGEGPAHLPPGALPCALAACHSRGGAQYP